MEKSVAILARTNSALRLYEEALGAAEIRYYLVGKSGFWGGEDVKSCLAYFQACVFPSDAAVSGMLRAPFFPTKYLPKSKIASALKSLKTEQDPLSHWERLTKQPRAVVEDRNLGSLAEFTRFVHSLSRYRDLPAGESAKQILTALKAFDHYAEEEPTPDNDSVFNIQTLVKIAGRHDTLKGFLDYARKVSAASKTKRGVALGTVHSFKGLEANTVYLVQCSEGVLPHVKSTDLDSERNVFFTGISRAERNLVVTYSGAPSPFIKHLVKEKSDAVL